MAQEKAPDPLLLEQAPAEEHLAAPLHVDGEGTMIRRPVASDNSCLFTSIRDVLEEKPLTSDQMRQLVSGELLGNADDYDAVVLGEDPVAYAKW